MVLNSEEQLKLSKMTSSLVSEIETRQKSARGKMQSKKPVLMAGPQDHGQISVQRRIQTGVAEGSDAFRRSPEDIVTEGRRKDWDIMRRREKPDYPEDK